MMSLSGCIGEKKQRSNLSEPQKLFILVRRDLSAAQRAVQACHALAELLFNHGDDL